MSKKTKPLSKKLFQMALKSIQEPIEIKHDIFVINFPMQDGTVYTGWLTPSIPTNKKHEKIIDELIMKRQAGMKTKPLPKRKVKR